MATKVTKDKTLDQVLLDIEKQFGKGSVMKLGEREHQKIDVIDLIGYSITEYDKDRLQFRVTINCYDYKLLNDTIISGSNLIKLEEVFLLTYEKVGNRWLITRYDKIYEKKLSD